MRAMYRNIYTHTLKSIPIACAIWPKSAYALMHRLWMNPGARWYVECLHEVSDDKHHPPESGMLLVYELVRYDVHWIVFCKWIMILGCTLPIYSMQRETWVRPADLPMSLLIYTYRMFPHDTHLHVLALDLTKCTSMFCLHLAHTPYSRVGCFISRHRLMQCI